MVKYSKRVTALRVLLLLYFTLISYHIIGKSSESNPNEDNSQRDVIREATRKWPNSDGVRLGLPSGDRKRLHRLQVVTGDVEARAAANS